MKFVKFFSILVVFLLLLWYGGKFLSFTIGIKPIAKLIAYLLFLGLFIFLAWVGKVKFSNGNLYKIFLFLAIVFSIYLLMAGILLLNDACPDSSDYASYLDYQAHNSPAEPDEPLLTPPPFFCPFSPVY